MPRSPARTWSNTPRANGDGARHPAHDALERQARGAASNAARLRWAVEVLDPRPTDALLEVGCGVGAAVELLAARLERGHIRALDRSAPMVAHARTRNAVAIASGRASIDCISVGDADLGEATFDAIFAFNVGLFWASPAAELAALVRALRPAGRLFVFHQAPVPRDMRAPIAALRARLAALGLDASEVRTKRLSPVPATCIVAGRAPGSKRITRTRPRARRPRRT